jgi:trigger factor
LKVEVAVTDAAECKKDLAIEIPSDEVKAEFEKTYDAYTKFAKVPGFRPGRVPRAVVKQRFRKDVKDDVLKELLPHALEHAIVDNHLRVVGSPEISDVTIDEGQPLRFKASVEVIPEFELRDYKNLKVVKRVAKVTDTDVDQVIEHLRERAAQLVPIEDRPSETGDFISVNLVGKYLISDGEAQPEDLRADDVQIELGGEGVQSEFNEGLTGVKADDVREFRVSYPEDFSSKGLAGKPVDFTATVTAVRRRELPELNDEFVQELGENQELTLEDFRKQTRADLEKRAEFDAEARLRDDLSKTLIDGYEFPLPESLVEEQTREMLQDLAYRMMRQLPPEAMKEINWEERRAEARLRAVRDLRSAIVVGRIADKEGIDVDQAEIDAEIDRIARSVREPEEAVRARFTKSRGLSSIENRLRFHKALDAVVKHAEVTTEELTQESIDSPPPSATEDQAPPATQQAESS